MLQKQKLKALMKVFLVAMLFFSFAVPSFADDFYPSRSMLGFEKKALTLFKEANDVKFSLANDGYVISLTRISTAERSEPYLGSFAMYRSGSSLRIGIDSKTFGYEYGKDDSSRFEFINNTFIGLNFTGGLSSGNVYFDFLFNLDVGKLDNFKDLEARPGYVGPGKGVGFWNSMDTEMKLAYKPSNISYFIGINSYDFDCDVTYSDYDGLPDVEDREAVHVNQGGYILGLEYQPSDKITVGFSANIPSGQTVLEGYRVYLSSVL